MHMTKFLDDALSYNMVRKTAEGLGTDDIIDTAFDQLQHFACKEPAFTCLVSKRNYIGSKLCCFIDISRCSKMHTFLKCI